ncbi:MAG: AMIN domain-containing protein [Nostocaceae cyanobacterium]|nr:AMIN domain-containing protein [Nostocaceae cyanobacterium]
MKQFHGNSLIFGATAAMVLVAQPVWAAPTQITQVELQAADGGVKVILKTSSGSRPQVFTTKRGKSLVADLINTQLKLPQGNSFSQNNPAPGIASVSINQLDTNSIRIVVTGNENAPSSEPAERKNGSIALSFTPGSGTQVGTTAPQQPSSPVANQPPATTPRQPPPMVPNPDITINRKPAPAAGPVENPNPAPPFLPRAVAPPVGDIAISNMDASPRNIDLGTQERVPRLVLRDASVREVLSLLARAAGLNLAYTNIGADGKTQGTGEGPIISLDIENEPVQDVFNHVLRLSGLEASRNGRTIFVGPQLPNSAREVIMRNIRLNQIKVDTALSFLVSLGAESAITRERLVTSVNAVPVGGGAESAVTQTQTTTELRVETLRTEFKDVNPLLRGLQASGDERTNSITLFGNPKLVELAISQLTQLDVRRRQVAVNVKIIDVNLLNTKDLNTSFSFGVGKNFFVNDGGTAAMNFGGVNPPSASATTDGVVSRPVTALPIPDGAEGAPFFDIQNDAPFGDTSFPGNNGSNGSLPNAPFARPNFGTRSNPYQPGVSEVTEDGLEFSLPGLFQYPKRFLATLQAQVTNGNAKILTDPTLTVQEGEEAIVKLTAEVYGGIEQRRVEGDVIRNPIIKDAGLTLVVQVDRIDDNGFVSLSVAPTVSAPNGTVPTPGDGNITLLSERSLRSGLVRLRDGQTLILSGIIQESDRVSVSKVPILGDIPLLGSLFRSTNKTNQRNEVIVLLTPQIMDDSQRSSYGYNYQPSPNVRQMLERRGLQMPRR